MHITSTCCPHASCTYGLNIGVEVMLTDSSFTSLTDTRRDACCRGDAQVRFVASMMNVLALPMHHPTRIMFVLGKIASRCQNAWLLLMMVWTRDEASQATGQHLTFNV
jgi:hypothetical protein